MSVDDLKGQTKHLLTVSCVPKTVLCEHLSGQFLLSVCGSLCVVWSVMQEEQGLRAAAGTDRVFTRAVTEGATSAHPSAGLCTEGFLRLPRLIPGEVPQ